MKILIVSGFYYPLNTPRAFRTTELVNEILKRGHSVTLVNALPVIGYNYQDSYSHNLKIYNIYSYRSIKLFNNNDKSSVVTTKKKRLFALKKKIARMIYYFTAYTFSEVHVRVKRCIEENLKGQKFDKIISIGLPVQCHSAVASCLKNSVISCDVAIADYGDPFSVQEDVKVAPYFRWFERNMLKNFNYVSIPIESAIKNYLKITELQKIRVIPQGFNFNDVCVSQYKEHRIPTFAFAGVLYANVRNPQLFLGYLSRLERDFKFIVYTNLESGDTLSILAPYKEILGEKLEIRPSIPRLKVIEELSKMDFLINFGNKTLNQSPSKIIDYALTKRPFINVSSTELETKIFEEFLDKNYTNSYCIDLEKYNIINVTNEFFELH